MQKTIIVMFLLTLTLPKCKIYDFVFNNEVTKVINVKLIEYIYVVFRWLPR